ncbi:MAG: zf-HC2 domain-containing protein [Thermomicrobiales bacterium]|nr:zf-HC2 domain-containing protein [Thermomicrobiales bacterium]
MSDPHGQQPEIRRSYRVGRSPVAASFAPAADDHVEDLAAAYALGALDGAERDLVEFHIRFCPRCAAAVERDLRATSMLPFMVVGRAVPAPDVKAALFARIAHTERVASAARLPAAESHAIPPTLTLPSSIPTIAPAAAVPPPVVAVDARGGRSWGWMASALSVPLLIALVATGAWGMQMRDQLTAQGSRVSSLEAQVANFGSGTSTYQLSPGMAMPQAEGKIVLGADERAGMLQVDLNSDTSAGSYELLVNSDGNLMPAGEVMIGPDGRGQTQFKLDQPFSAYESIEIKPKLRDGKTVDAAVLRGENGGLGSTGSELDMLP